MSDLAQWAENDDGDEDDNIVWDESTDQKLAENRGGFHLRKRSLEGGQGKLIPQVKITPAAVGPRLITPTTTTATNPPAAPHQVKKKDTRKANKFGLGERPISSPSATSPGSQKIKLDFRSTSGGVNAKRRGLAPSTSNADIASASSSGTSTSNGATLKSMENPEQLRRFLLAEVKQMTIERLVADAKRYMYLEEFHAKHTTKQPQAVPSGKE
ncbi:hypothetical protein Ae201684P_008296 [Aphanomyces euteiches]|uniref:Uncharacterized protein n=1 Tax=Aphanomyces euteiches TaxID=100861 RepID=A0A6G0XFH8_9STRA|nr:hypothetical protein Ae201684_005452 [Aphanomyces euteiches]KAH9092625.1 hypothetical protein Ae201684P_008296 [Aphanomyces euteiches]KAH9136788.1 hypothetical protein AeRB84_018233 [Aphanomyces euteiches]